MYWNTTYLFLFISIGFSGCRDNIERDITPHPSLPFNSEFVHMEIVGGELPRENIEDFIFLSEDIGFFTIRGGRIYKTNDGGRTWIAKYLTKVPNVALQKILFTSQQVGYVVGGKAGCSGNGCIPPGGIILKTTDGGENWKIVNLTPGSLEYVNIAQTSNGDLYVIRDLHNKCWLHKSTDEGETWEFVTGMGMEHSEFEIINDSLFIFGHQESVATMAVSGDFGKSWNFEKSFVGNARWVRNTTAHSSGIFCLTDNMGLQFSANGGKWWSVLRSAESQGLREMYSLDVLGDSTIIIWGRFWGETIWGRKLNGGFTYSSNLGKSWSTIALSNLGTISHSAFYSSNEGYVCIEGRSLIKVVVK